MAVKKAAKKSATKKAVSTKSPKAAAAPKTAPAAPASGGGRKSLMVALIAVVVIAGLGIQTWLMARHKAAMTFDLLRQGPVIQKGLDDGQLMGATSLDADGAGNLYVLDMTAADRWRLQKFGPDNAFIARYKPRRAAEDFRDVSDMAVAKDGSLAVLQRNGDVLLFDADMAYQSTFATGLGGTVAIAVNSKGQLFVSSIDANKVVSFDTTGKKLGEFGAPGTNSGDLSQPARMRFLNDDRLVVTELLPTGPRLKVFNPDLTVQRKFAAADGVWSEAVHMGVNMDGLAFFNDQLGDKGVVVYDLNRGKYVGNTKGTTSGDLFISPGALGGSAWSHSVIVGSIAGYFRAMIGAPEKK